MKNLSIPVILIAFLFPFTACDSEEQRDRPEQVNEDHIRPEIDGSEAIGQSPNDTLSSGDDGATSY